MSYSNSEIYFKYYIDRYLTSRSKRKILATIEQVIKHSETRG